MTSATKSSKGRPFTEEEKKKLYYDAITHINAAGGSGGGGEPRVASWRCLTQFCDLINFPKESICSQCKVPRDRDSITKARLTKLTTEFLEKLKADSVMRRRVCVYVSQATKVAPAL